MLLRTKSILKVVVFDHSIEQKNFKIKQILTVLMVGGFSDFIVLQKSANNFSLFEMP